MKLQDIGTPVSTIAGVGPSLEKLLARLGIFTVSDLLSYWPKTWEDRTRKIPLSAWNSTAKVHTIAQVLRHDWFGFGRMRTLKIIIDDGTASAALVCFNRSFLEKTLPVGSVIAVTGRFAPRYGQLQSTAFEATCLAKSASIDEFLNAPVPGSAVFPIYPLTAGLSQVQLRKVISKALKEYCRGIENELPESVIEKRELMPKKEAVFCMHQPRDIETAEKAKFSLIYEELYHFQETILRRSEEHRKTAAEARRAAGKGGTSFEETLSPRQEQLLARLPFKLTEDQKKVIYEMNVDIDLSNSLAESSQGSPGGVQNDGTGNAFGADGSFVKPGDSAERACCASDSVPEPAQFHMSRLLQGDVGSGKTLAAFFAALRTVDYGGQCVMMAPTEILARQHANNAATLLEPLGIRVAFLTGNLKASGRTPLLAALKNGDIDIVIGTHAVFSQSVLYHDLRFVIIDEQHRFGVVQRNAILDKGRQSVVQKERLAEGKMPRVPDFLLMSATPIPQTLAHTIFGDLDISIIKSMPAGRQPIKTYLTKEGNESRVYEAVRKELQSGHQAYFVYPLIEGLSDDVDSSASGVDDTAEDGDGGANYANSPNSNSTQTGGLSAGYPESSDRTENRATPGNGQKALKSAEAMFSFLSQKVYPEFKCALIHSKTDEADQIAVLESFRKGETQVLVATSVVEVGVDVPNATCMVIEHAERFGLAALHQLRGRVGRGTAASFCFLVYSEKLTELGKARLKVLHESTDGFYIGEEDLKLRGPGDVNGIQQSGYITLGIADPVRDKAILELARADILETYAN